VAETAMARPAIIRRKASNRRLRETIQGYLFISPVVLGLLIFTIGPMLISLYLSFTKFPLLRSPEWIGIQNYVNMFTREPDFWQASRVTLIYAFTSVPLGLLGGFALAMLLNQRVKGIAFFRTSFYMPSIVPAIASLILWGWLLNRDYGLVNAVLVAMGFQKFPFLAEPSTALFSLVLMSLWGLGAGMIIFLAGLQGIPESLYEAAKIDGANELQLFKNITVPMMTPTIFFNMVIGLIAASQTFMNAWVLTKGGPLKATYFFNLMLYERAFQWTQMGMASAMAWFLLVVVLILTALVFRSSSAWVYYETEVK
jgi:multiple sugar transport system permease protein